MRYQILSVQVTDDDTTASCCLLENPQWTPKRRTRQALPTLFALKKIEKGTATQISAITQRCRAFESKNLNELHMLGVVSKERSGRERVFTMKTLHSNGEPVSSFFSGAVLDK